MKVIIASRKQLVISEYILYACIKHSALMFVNRLCVRICGISPYFSN
jgi:hypothetical protein